MWMEPIGSSAVDHLEIIDLRLARLNCLHGLTIAFLWHAQAMRMEDTFLCQVIVEIDANRCTTLRTDDRSEVRTGQILYRHTGAAQQLPLIAPDLRLRARQDLHIFFQCCDRDLCIRDKGLHGCSPPAQRQEVSTK